MILQNLKNNNTLTSSEKAAADYILKNPDKVLKMTSRELAEQIYVSAPTIIRLCKKLGYESFTDFKMDLSKATTDEYQKMLNIDYNFPFSKETSLEEAVNSLSTIAISNIMKLRDNFDYPALQKICNILANKHFIDIYGTGLSIKCAAEFREKMMHIGYHVTMVDEDAQADFWAHNANESQCALMISYSGKTTTMRKVIKILHKKNVKVILITGNPQADMVKYADVVYYIQSDEQLEMSKKIDSFGVQYDMHYVLDCIYTGVFLQNYDSNYEKTKYYGDYQFKSRE